MRRSSTAVAALEAVQSEDQFHAGPSAAGSSTRTQAPEQGLRTEFSFLLPRGYVDGSGTVHRDGVMRLATARDELVPLRDDRVRENPAYLTVVLLGRVVTRIGTIDDVHAGHHREPVRLGPGVPAGPVPAGQSGGPHPGRGDLPELPARIRRRRRWWAPGGIVTYAPDRIYEEVAYIAFHFHWPTGRSARSRAPRTTAVRRRDRPYQQATSTEGGDRGTVVEAGPRHGSGLHT